MKFFGLLFLLVIFISSDFTTSSQIGKVAKKEAKYYCQCLGKFNKKLKRLERKAKKNEKQRNKNYRPGGKLFGGYELDFDLEGCVAKKRNRKQRKFIKSLSEEEKEYYKNKIRKWIRKRCPGKIPRGYF